MEAESLHTQETAHIKLPIYELIEQDAACEDVVRQMYMDYFATRDNEKVLLGLRNLQSRGVEGAAYIRQISCGSDELSQQVKEVQDGGIDGEEAERVFGIQRFEGETIMTKDIDETRAKILKHFTALGFIGSMEDIIEIRRRDYDLFDRSPVSVSLSGEVEKTTFNVENTFGADEPIYLELLGPEEILRLRSLEQPSMLLLGSLGKYSARAFRSMADKINLKTETTVIDIDENCLAMIKSDTNNRNITVQGDVKDLPFHGDIMDHVYSNSLLHYMLDMEGGDIDSVQRVFNQAYRVLKPKGSFLISEVPFGGLEGEPLEDKIKSFALQSGFSKVISSRRSCVHILRKENSSSTIDENGFPHHKGLISRGVEGYMNFRFIK